MRTKEKRVLDILLNLALALGLVLGMSVTVWADESVPYLAWNAENTHNHDGITFTEWTDALAVEQNGAGKTASNSLPAASGNYYLTSDVELNESWYVLKNEDEENDININLCLDGHSIKDSREKADVAVIIINSGTLSLYDKEDNSGKITGGTNGGVYINNTGTFNMFGGTITGNTGYGGVNMGGTFNMYGGKISDNCAGEGGGVRIQGSEDSIFTMSGAASITGNTATESGGGVYVESGNSDQGNGPGKLIISGSAGIHGNTDEAATPAASNVFLGKDNGENHDPAYDAKITITDKLTGSASIGVTMEEPGVFTSGLSKGGDDAIKMFASDKTDYEVVKEGDEAKLLKKVAKPTFDPVGGKYTSVQSVTISCETEGATIHYTTDGSNPTPGSAKYTGKIKVSSTSTIKAIAVKTGMVNSEIASAKYEIDVDPHGNLDAVTGKEGCIDVAGWAFDPSDTAQQIDVYVYIGGAEGSTEAGDPVIIKANTERTDVDAVYNCGGQHGFGETITTSKRGEQNVYVYAINIGDGKNVCLGNKNVTITETGTPTLYQLQYDPGYGGSGSMEPETVAVGDKVILPECSFKAPLGKKFYKWQISGVDGIFDPGYEYTVVENSIMGNVITVTATWKEAPPATVTTAPTAKALICTGAEQELVNAGAASGGVMSYAIGNDSINAPTSGWNVKIPKKAAAGTYYVWYKAVGDVSHSDTEPKCVTVTIAKQNPKVVTEVTVNAATVNAKAIAKAIKKAGTTKAKVKTIVLGNKVRKIGKKAFKNYKKANTLIVKTKKLKKSKVKGSLKGSKITKVKVQVGSKKANKKFVKKYKKIFKKKNAGKKVKVTI